MSGYPSTKNLASHPGLVNRFLRWKGLRAEKDEASDLGTQIPTQTEVSSRPEA